MAASPARPWCLKSGSAGRRFSCFALTDGRTMVLLPPAQDTKES